MRIRLSQCEVALHPRRIVVDAERQVGGIGDVEEEPLDVGFRRADIGRRGQDRAVAAVVLGEAHIGDGRFGVVAGAAEEDRHFCRLHLRRLDDDLLLLLGRQHGGLAGRAHDQHRLGAVLLLEPQQGLERREIHRAVLVERRDQRDERAGDFLFGHAVSISEFDSLPLVGRVGWGSGGDVLASTLASYLATPTPAPPHKGEGNRFYTLT